MKRLLLAILLTFSAACAADQAVNVQKKSGTNEITGNIVVPTGKSITVNSGASIIAAPGATVTGFGGGGGNSTWGYITGNILSQTDLQTQFGTKVPTTTQVNGHALSGNVTVTKSDVGLANVDNTSDANKPVSTATQTALNAKVPTTRTVNGQALSADVNINTTVASLPGPLGNTTLVFTNTIGGESSTLYGPSTAITKIAAPSQATIVADTPMDTITFAGAGGATVSTNTTTKTVTITAGGGGGGGNITGSFTTDNRVTVTSGTNGLVQTPVVVNPGTGDLNAPTGAINILTANIISGASANGMTILGNATSGNFEKASITAANGLTAATAPGALAIKGYATTQVISAADIDWSTGSSFSKTLSANTTFTFSNAPDGQTITVAVTNTASNYTVTWPTVSWSGGTTPTQTTGAKTDIWTFIKVGSTIYGNAIQNF